MCASVAALGAMGLARAQAVDASSDPAIAAIPLVVITGTRTPQSLADIPQAMSVLTAEEIRRRQARTPNLMLAEEPGVWSAQNSVQGAPIIRGQIGNRVLYLWDGIRINNGALFSGPNGFFNQFPVGSVARMEVLRGPGAVQYGSDAIGGVVNVIGKQADPFAAPKGLSGDVGARFGSVDDELTLYSDLSLVGDSSAATVGVSGQRVGDYRGPGLGRIANTGYKNWGGHAGWATRVGAGQTVRLALVGDERSDVETYTQSKLNAGGIPRIFGPYERRHILKADYDAVGLGRFSDRLNGYAYFQDYAASRVTTNEAAAAFSTTTALTEQKVGGLGMQNTASFGPARVTLGGDARFEKLASSRQLDVRNKATGNTVTSVPNGQVPDGHYDVLDAFVLTDWALSHELTLNLGGRYEQIHLKSNPAPEDALTPFTVNDLRLDRTWHAPTFSAGLLYKLSRAWSLAANAATGFRAPSYSDTLSTGVPVFATGVATVPSPTVEPEHTRSYEVSARYASAAGWGSLTAYQLELKDLVTSVASGTINIPGVGVVTAQHNANTGHGRVSGIEFDAGWVVAKGWTVFGSATYTHGVDTNAHVPLRFMPPLNGRIGVRSEGEGWWAEGALRLAKRLTRHAPQDEIDAGFSTDPALGSPNATTNPPYRPGFEIPGFAVLNLRGGMQLRTQHGERIDLTLSLNNVLDNRYREAYAQQQLLAPGRSVVLGAAVAF